MRRSRPRQTQTVDVMADRKNHEGAQGKGEWEGKWRSELRLEDQDHPAIGGADMLILVSMHLDLTSDNISAGNIAVPALRL